MKHGFFRIACASPEVKIADCPHNAEKIITLLKKAESDGIECMVFPELSLSGCTCADLFLQSTLIDETRYTLAQLAERTKNCPVLFTVGAPLEFGSALFNCAVFMCAGKILAAVPKIGIGSGGNYDELRRFKSGSLVPEGAVITIGSQTAIPFGTDILIHTSTQTCGISEPLCAGRQNTAVNIYLAARIGEDVYYPFPAEIYGANGGTILPDLIVNLCAENSGAGTKRRRHLMLSARSIQNTCSCACANAGAGESTGDLIFEAHNIVCENGRILAESGGENDGYIAADTDMEYIRNARLKRSLRGGYGTDRIRTNIRIVKASIEYKTAGDTGGLKRDIARCPFVPENKTERNERCAEISRIQALGLAGRLQNTGIQKAVLGVSGGLDSALALLAAVNAFKLCKLPLTSIYAFSLPCFGTSVRTKSNAEKLAFLLGVRFAEIDIQNAVRAHLADIGASGDVHDSVYENAQARERTQILMDSANKYGALVIGTGDLSESALGWTTYNGDHISMYGVNAGIPKTLARALVIYAASHSEDYCAVSGQNAALAAILTDIVDTPVSPELLPAKNGNIVQKTEDILGPYELHDFFLYYVVRRGFSPTKILFLAGRAFADTYNTAYIKEKLTLFYRRFFSQQFKRSCMPDGVSSGSLSLSPRGGWAMPSDAQAELWLQEIGE